MSNAEAESKNTKSQNIHDPIKVLEQDILERQRLADRILKRLREEGCPSTLGIYGGWGTGKTSLLNLLEHLNKQLPERESGELCILSIDAWEYESSDGLLIPVVVELKRLTGNGELPHVWKNIVKRALITTALSFSDALLKKFLDLDRKQIKETYVEVEARDADDDYVSVLQKWELQFDEVEGTKTAFKELVKVIREKNKCRNIVICIDNLDRCSPDNVVRLLESVKVFFNVPGCTWVFAIDSEVVANYINHKYQGARMDGNSYLDKIIPEQYHLSLSPTIDRAKIVKLLRYLVDNNALELNEKDIPQIPRVLVPRRLIKSAAKVVDFYKLINRDDAHVPQTLVFYLALLYHVWPDFYQRFSSSSETHIRSILDNFFLPETSAQVAVELPPLTKTNLLPLSKDYAEDQDLAYYMKTVFSGYGDQRRKNIFVDEIISGISGLRKTGLP
jgi:hypothetical protein